MDSTPTTSRVLLVDDSSRDLYLLKEAFASIGSAVEVDTCTTGHLAFVNLQAALLTAEEPLPDLLVFDIHMPGVTGLDLLQAIKGTDGLKAIPVVMITTAATLRDRECCDQFGVIELIKKPADYTAYIALARHLTSLFPAQK